MLSWTTKTQPVLRRISTLAFCVAAATALPACDMVDLTDLEAACEALNKDNGVAPITKKEVLAAQKTWGDGIVKIGKAFTDKGDYKKVAENHVDTLYAYGQGTVLFKPTKAAEQQFRLTKTEALSYFVTGSVAEDKGFALQPWTAVRFDNAGIIIRKDQAIAMGNYFFTDAKTGKETKVEYTFGYVRNKAGDLVINVHHSALPYPSPKK